MTAGWEPAAHIKIRRRGVIGAMRFRDGKDPKFVPAMWHYVGIGASLGYNRPMWKGWGPS